MSEQPLSAIAEINPPLPRHVHDAELVSFVGMSDVKESGGITSIREVPFEAVKAGFTRFAEGDVLFAKITPCMENGKGALAAGLTNGIGCGSTEFHVLRAKGENCNGFIYQVVQSRAFRQKAEMNMSGSAGQQRVPSDFFKEFPVHIPDPPQQRRIAEILSTLDEAIEQTEALIAKMQQVKAGLMHDLFTRGVTPDGRLRPTREQAPELYKESPIGWIPREWEISTLADVADVNRGKFSVRPRNDPRYYGGEYPFIQTGDISLAQGRVLTAYSQTLNAAGLAVSRLFETGTIMVTIAANIADTCILGVPMCAPDSLVGVQPNRGQNTRFLELCIRRRKSWFEGRAPQTAQRNINLEDLRPLLIPSPSFREQKIIEEIYEAIDASHSTSELEVEKLRQKKHGLMYELFSGQSIELRGVKQ